MDAADAEDARVQALLALLAEKDEQYGRLKETMAEKDEQYGRLKKTMAEKDKEYGQFKETMAEKMAEKDKALAKKDEKMAEKDKALAKKDDLLQKSSIELLLEGMPDLARNPKCTPHIASNVEKVNEEWKIYEEKWKIYEEKWKIYEEALKGFQGRKSARRRKGRNKPPEDQEEGADPVKPPKPPKPPKKPNFHNTAIIEKDDLSQYMDFDFVTKINGEHIHSRLLSAYQTEGNPHFTLYNEACVQNILRDAIIDVVNAYQMKKVQVIPEASLFSVRPDLMVVRYMGTMLFMVELKNPPNTEQEDVCSSETAVGQAYDYNVMQKTCGHDYPFTILSTYSETVVVREAANDEAYHTFLSNGRDLLREKKIEKFCAPDIKAVASPARKHLQQNIKTYKAGEIRKAEKKRKRKREGGTERKGNGNERKAKVSEVFTNDKLYKLIALTFAASIRGIEESRESREKKGVSLIPKPGHSFAGKKEDRKYILQSSSFGWAKADCTVSYNIIPDFEDDSEYYVYCTLGQGRTGRCALCSDEIGNMFVAKLFLFEPSLLYTQKERENEEEERRDVKQVEAEKEMNRWLHLYPKYKGYYKVIMLNQTPALTMPFFSPIPIEERENVLNNRMKDLLVKIAKYGYEIDDDPPETEGSDNPGAKLEDNLYYFYHEIRWRHFGCRDGEEGLEITALDLGSLGKIQCSGESEMNEKIETQISELRDRRGEPQTPIRMPIIKQR